MITLLTIVGIILFALSILIMLSKFSSSEKSTGLRNLPRALTLILFFGGGILMFASTYMFYAKPGFQYYIISPFGTKSVSFESGYKLTIPFSRVQEWQKFVDIKVVLEGEPDEGIEGIIPEEIPIRFIDQVTAGVKISVRMQIPQDPASFIRLAEEFREPMNLVNNTLIPTVREQTINTGYMFKAQDYISGAAADFRVTLDEQLKNGGYSIERREFMDTVYAEIQEEKREIQEINSRYEVIKRLDENGMPIRVEHDIKKNNILVSQVIVDQVNLESQFKKRLEEQRDISAQKRIEMQKIETAKTTQQRIIAEGERDKAAERVAQEKEQVKALIAIETQKKQEVTKKELAKIAFETAKLEAMSVKVKADAKAYENAKLVKAGLTPQERAEIDKEIAIGVAEAMSALNLPQVYIGSSAKSGQNGILAELLGAEFAKKMIKPSGKK